MVDNHGVFAALQSKPLWKCRKQSQTPKDCKLQLSPVHFAQDLGSIEPYWTIELFVLQNTYASKRRLHQCFSAASAFGTFEPNKFLRKRLAAWENTSSENTETLSNFAVLLARSNQVLWINPSPCCQYSQRPSGHITSQLNVRAGLYIYISCISNDCKTNHLKCATLCALQKIMCQ